MIGAEFAHAAGYSGTGRSIGVVDSGSFRGHMRPGANFEIENGG